MFNDSTVAMFKQKLLEQRASLLSVAQTATEAAQTVELDQSRVGRLSRMDALQEQAMSQERLRRRERELVSIAAALKRIELNEYGDCIECGEAIAEARLAFNPSVALCLRCASEREKS